MPAKVTHWLLGQKVLGQLKESADIPDFDGDSFLVGCQGPDVLFFHRVLPWMFGRDYRWYGHEFHDRAPSGLFDSMRRTLASCKEEERRYVLGYCLGICCHYAYDTETHPYVIWLSEEMEKTDRRGAQFQYHIQIESALDVIMLRLAEGTTPAGLKLKECIPGGHRTRRAVADVWKNAVSDVFGEEMPERAAMQLMPDMKAAARFLEDRHYRKLPFFLAVEKLTGDRKGSYSAHVLPEREDDARDYANEGHLTWHNPMAEEITRTESFFELTDAAERYSLEMARFFLDACRNGGDFAAFTGERTFSYGVRAEDASV